MRILFVTSHYEPSPYGGGYAQLCEEVVDGLHARGHQVAVLTSTYGQAATNPYPYPVARRLPIDPDWHDSHSAAWQFFVQRPRRERQAVSALCEMVDAFAPDVIYVWHAIGLPRAMLHEAEERSGAPIAYYLANYLPEIADEYLDYWRAAPQTAVARLLKRPLALVAQAMLHHGGKPVPLRFDETACVSDYVRQRLLAQGLIGPRSVVIHNGVDLTVFCRSDGDQRPAFAPPLRCLVAGRVDPEKGVHTVVEAFGLLAERSPSPPATLTVLGDGPPPYLSSLRDAARALGLQGMVQFRAGIPRTAMPGLLAEFDVLILASEYAEPLARAAQEAMAMGLLVVGTITGGSGELLVHEETGLAFVAGDAASLTQQLERIAVDPALARRLARAGHDAVRERFGILHTVLETEQYLQRLMDDSLSAGAADTHADVLDGAL